MQNNNLQYRFYIFLGLTCLLVPLYQSYHNYQIDRQIEESLKLNNKATTRYSKIISDLRQARNHWASMYYSSKYINGQLEQQIETISNYWTEQYTELNDKYFDLKNSK